MANKNGLTATFIFEAESANYGESIGNITALKKMSRSDGNMYSYISRQAMRYNIVEQMGVDNTPVSGKEGAVQFAKEATIKDYPEIDLFGYMRTKSKSNGDAGGADTRNAVVRLSNAVAAEPYSFDLDFLTNMGLTKRGDEKGGAIKNNIAQSEIHRSFYSYTITIDLDRVGVDGDISLSKDEKARRVMLLLETLRFLYRDIKGRRENMAPVFAIGGVYQRKCPYFEGRCRLAKGALDCDMLREVMDSCGDTKENTSVGLLKGVFANSGEIAEKLGAGTVDSVFETLKKEVKTYYA